MLLAMSAHRATTGFCLALGLVLAGCASTKVQNVWEAKNLDELAVQHALVVGMMKDEATRRAYETGLAQKLQEKGVRAEESFKFIEPADKLTQENLKPLTQEHGFDGVFVGRVTQ